MKTHPPHLRTVPMSNAPRTATGDGDFRVPTATSGPLEGAWRRAPLRWLCSVVFIVGCSAAAQAPPDPGDVREVQVSTGARGDGPGLWRIGATFASTPRATFEGAGDEQDLMACRETTAGLTWSLVAREADGLAWRALCRGSAYQAVERPDGCGARLVQPTAVECRLEGLAAAAQPQGFRLELTNLGPDAGIGRLVDAAGTVDVDRMAAPEDAADVPDRFVLRHAGIAIGWLETRPTPRLLVRRDLAPGHAQAAERAALLALALDAHAARRLRGTVAWPAAWARSAAPHGVASAVR